MVQTLSQAHMKRSMTPKKPMVARMYGMSVILVVGVVVGYLFSRFIGSLLEPKWNNSKMRRMFCCAGSKFLSSLIACP